VCAYVKRKTNWLWVFQKNSNETKSFVIEENRPVTRQSFQHESSHSFDWFQTCEPTIYEQNHILINCTLYHHPNVTTVFIDTERVFEY